MVALNVYRENPLELIFTELKHSNLDVKYPCGDLNSTLINFADNALDALNSNVFRERYSQFFIQFFDQTSQYLSEYSKKIEQLKKYSNELKIEENKSKKNSREISLLEDKLSLVEETLDALRLSISAEFKHSISHLEEKISQSLANGDDINEETLLDREILASLKEFYFQIR